MKVRVDQVKESPEEVEFSGDPTWNRAAEERIPELAAPGSEALAVELRSYRIGTDLLLEGRLRGALGLECGRCLARYRHALAESFRLVLEPAGARLPADPEAARSLAEHGFCLGDELELGWFQGHEIDLTPFVLEVVALAIPVQPLCRESCKGLCPQCGADRNETECGCEAPRDTSPFAVLKSLQTRVREDPKQ